jgi:hypothetical protein
MSDYVLHFLFIVANQPDGRINSLSEYIQPRRRTFQIPVVDFIDLVQQANPMQPL